MIPAIAIVGRPNVGKSTLFNSLVRSRDALVADVPGLTRDRRYGIATLDSRRATLIDTGGFESDAAGLAAQVAGQTRRAAQEAALILLVVDAAGGLTVEDERLAAWLRRLSKPAWLVVNKADGADGADAAAEFQALGLARWQAISALHGRGLAALRAALAEALPDAAAEPPASPKNGPMVAVIGRPNVGKSTLVNRMLGEERMLVRDAPGTTRDSIDVTLRHRGRPYTLVDTAGLRRRPRIVDTVEKFSALKALQAVERADVSLLLVNARDGVVSQDLQLLNYVLDAGCGLVIAINQWDSLDASARRAAKAGLERSLRFLDFAEMRYISARTGFGVLSLYRLIDRVHASATATLATPRLTRLVREASVERPPPLRRGRRPKLRYAHAGGNSPPVVVIHGARAEDVPAHYQQYLRRRLRERLSLVGVPLRLEFSAGENPYAGRRNVLTPRQRQHRARLMRHVKKR